MCTMFIFMFIVVCRDMELRVNNKNSGHGIIAADVCINDQWHEATSAKVASNSHQSPQNISIQVNSTSVTIMWSEQTSPNDTVISGYDLSCTTSALSDGQIHEVKVLNVSASTTQAHIHGLLLSTEYKCCVNAHILTNTPLDLISSNCVTTITVLFLTNQGRSDDVLIGLGTGLGISSLLLVCLLVGFIISTVCCLKHGSKVDTSIK